MTPGEIGEMAARHDRGRARSGDVRLASQSSTRRGKAHRAASRKANCLARTERHLRAAVTELREVDVPNALALERRLAGTFDGLAASLDRYAALSGDFTADDYRQGS